MSASSSTHKPFLVICLTGFLVFFSSYLRIPVMPLYAASLGASTTMIGVVNSAFMLTAGLLSIPAGLIIDRAGRRIPVVAGITAVALSSLAVYYCRVPGEMAVAYVLFGVGLAAYAPGMLALVADVMPANRLGQAYGWYTTAVYTAMTIGPACGGFLATGIGLRKVFLMSGGLSLLFAVLALFILPRGTHCHRSDSRSVLAVSAQLMSNVPFVGCLLATFGSCIGFGLFLTFMPLAAAAQGLNTSQAGIILASQAFTNVVCRIPIGICSDRVDRRYLVAAGLLLLATALYFLGHAKGLLEMSGCAVLLGIGMALTYTAIGALVAMLVPPLLRGVAMGMYNSCIYIGMMSGSLLMGRILEHFSYAVGFSGGAAIAGVTGALFMILSWQNSRAVP